MSNVGRFTPRTSVRLPRRQEPARAPRRRARVPLVSRRLALWTRMPSSPIRRPGDSGPSGQAVGGIERKVGSGSNHGRPGKITELQRRYRTMRRCPWADAVPTAVRTGGTAHESNRTTSTVRDTSAIQRQSASSRTAPDPSPASSTGLPDVGGLRAECRPWSRNLGCVAQMGRLVRRRCIPRRTSSRWLACFSQAGRDSTMLSVPDALPRSRRSALMQLSRKVRCSAFSAQRVWLRQGRCSHSDAPKDLSSTWSRGPVIASFWSRLYVHSVQTRRRGHHRENPAPRSIGVTTARAWQAGHVTCTGDSVNAHGHARVSRNRVGDPRAP